MIDKGPRVHHAQGDQGRVGLTVTKTDGGWLLDAHAPGSQVILFLSDADVPGLIEQIEPSKPEPETEQPASEPEAVEPEPAPEPVTEPAPETNG